MNSGELNLKFIYDVENRITEEGLNNSSTHILPAQCVLVGLAGQGKTRGTAAYNFVPLCTNQSIAAFLPTDKHSSLYLYYIIDNQYDYLRLLSSGDGGRGGLNKQLLSSLNIVLPPYAEQRTIAKALSDVDALIAALDKKIAKKRLIKQGAMQQLLTGRKRLRTFSEKLVSKSFSQIFQHVSTRGCNVDAIDYNNVGKYPIIDQGKEIIVGYTNKIKPCKCPFNGVIVFGDHTRIFKYIDFDFCVGADGTQVLVCDGKFDTKYVYYICSITEIPNTGYNRHFKFLKEREFVITPDINEQQAIATILSDMDREISELETRRDKHKLIKSGMMQKLLTGQIRLI